MADIQSTIVYVRQPTGEAGDLGAVDYAHYKVEAEVLTLTDQQGHPMRKNNGEIYGQKLEPDDDPRRIAIALWRDMRSELDPSAEFNAPIRYPDIRKDVPV
jgi:hypothetical protein